MVGAGILLLPGTAATMAGPASVLSWGVVCLLGLPLALTFASLARRIPDAGGVATFTARAFGPLAGGIVGWFYFVASANGQIIVPLTGGYYASLALGLDRFGAFVVAGAIVAVSVAMNLAGLRVSARAQVAFAGAVAAVLVVACAVSAPRMSASAWTPFAPHGYAAAGNALRLIFFAVFGWEAIAQLSAEFRDPRRDVLRATLLSLAVVTLLYVGIAVATVATRSYGSAATDRVAVAVLIGRGVGLAARDAAAVVATLLALATCNAFVAASARLCYALSRDGFLPRRLGALSSRGVPRGGVWLVGAWAGLGLGACYAAGAGAERLLVVSNSLGLMTYVLGTAAGVKLLAGVSRGIAAAACVLCIGAVPFFGFSAVIPVAVALLALASRLTLRRLHDEGSGTSPRLER